MTARDRLAVWLGLADEALDVGQQTASRPPGGIVISGMCWRCMRTEATTRIGLCDPCLSWCRCDDLLADSAATPATSSPTVTVGSAGM